MATWKCPDPDCPATESPPSALGATFGEDNAERVLCGGACGQEYSATEVKPIG